MVAYAVEVANLPPGITYDEVRAVMGAQAAAFSLGGSPGDQLSALVMLASPQAAAETVELLDGSDWGGRTLAVRTVDAGGWLAEHCSKCLPGGGASSSSGAQQQSQQAARPPPPPSQQHAQQQQQHAQQQQQQQQPYMPIEEQPRAPGFELPDWGWDQAPAAAQQAQHAQQHTQPQGWGDEDFCWPSSPGSSSGGSEDEEWREVVAPGRERRPRSGSTPQGGSSTQPGGGREGQPVGWISDTRLMIRNLQPEVMEQAIIRAFSRFGRIVQAIKLPNRRFAHLQFGAAESAAAALREMHEQMVPELNAQGLIIVHPSMMARNESVQREAAELAAAALQRVTASSSSSNSRGGVPGSGRGSGPGRGGLVSNGRGGRGGGISGGATAGVEGGAVASMAGFGASAGGDRDKGISAVPTAAVWVGNVGPAATAEDVRVVFSRYGPLVQWQLQQAKLPGKQELRYAIVRWRKVEHAQAAMAALHKQVAPEMGPSPLKLRYRSV